ncbi:MAG: glycine--tRNA ligase [Euryarchaeota archaeon CG01_land_8_20_14_3_00_38_12]|nr:MAG: glycine--tRNA ligase [Euryarchaeota archaeon CG01_land_8_20_14_3_00_38_12]
MDSAKIWSAAKRRGFIWPAVEIYGGLAGFYDYGHLGAVLKRKWENLWLKYFLSLGDYCLIDTVNILPESSLKASGHTEHFTDVLVECSRCKHSFKADHLIEGKTGESAEGLTVQEIDTMIKNLKIGCPDCKGGLGNASVFNMMFPVSVGPKGRDKAFLRPETAQGVYLNFRREFETLRKKLPLGLAVIGKAYRNEISPRQGVYRMRELIQAELQIFFDPDRFDNEVNFEAIKDSKLRIMFANDREKIKETAGKELVDALPKFYLFHMAKIQDFYVNVLNVPLDKFRFYEKTEKEKAFYNKIHFDVELNMESLGGFREVAGIHYRGDYDLLRHQEGSKQSMEVNIDGKKLIPHVLELSFGVDRNFWSMLDLFFAEEEKRVVLKLPHRLAPKTLAVFPLVNKNGLPEKSKEIYSKLKERFDVFYDDSGSIGRRYARMDEIGTPYCITIDYQTMEDDTITIRDRDTTQQVRVKVDEIENRINGFMDEGKISGE